MESVGVPFRDSEREQWLASEPTWKHRLGEGWKGVKFLGRGNFGIVGLWRFIETSTTTNPPAIKAVVVKQTCQDLGLSQPVWGGMTAFDEGNILKLLSATKTNHIIKQYGGIKAGEEYGTMDLVIRLFLEYCPGGGLDRLIGGINEPRLGVIEEADIWEIFLCLVLGLIAMDRGTEDPEATPWLGFKHLEQSATQICHFDIKPDNLLFSNRDPEHPRIPILKVSGALEYKNL